MDNVLDTFRTTEDFLAWEDRQEGKYEFDSRNIVPMTGGSYAHQRIGFNLCVALMNLLGDRPLIPVLEMRLRAGTRIRYPDLVVCVGPLDQATRTLTDAIAIFEIISPDTAETDRITKLRDYAAVPSRRCYVVLEQTAVAATLFQRQPDRTWTDSRHTSGDLRLPGLDVTLPLAIAYCGLNNPAQG